MAFNMTTFATTFATSQGVQKRSVEDMILLINPHKTPYLSTIKKGRKPAAFIHQWPVRKVPTAVVTSVADGTDVSSSDATNVESLKKILGGRPHQLQRVAFTGNLTAELENQYGIKDLHADTVMQQMEALKWDTEVTLLGKQESEIATNTHTTRGVCAWLGLGTTSGTPASATSPYTGYTVDAGCLIDSTVRTVSGANVLLGTTNATASDVTEANLRGLLQAIFDATYSPLNNALGICTSGMKAAISNFSIKAAMGNMGYSDTTSYAPVRMWNNQDGNVLGANITRVEADFGTIDLVPHVGLPTGSTATECYPFLYVLDRDTWEFLPVQPLHMQKMVDNGGGPRTLLRTSFMHKCTAPIRNGQIYWKAA